MAFPIKIQVDLPLPVVKQEKGYDYEHRFDAPDNEYVWSKTSGESTVWRDPKRHTLMLKPAPFSSAWQTDTTGIWYRPGLAHYSLDDGSALSNWEEYDYSAVGDTWLLAKTTNERITLRSALPNQESGKFAPNQGFFLRTNPFGPAGSRGTYFEMEWGRAVRGSGNAQFKMIVALDGTFTLEKNGTQVYEGWLTPIGRDRFTLPQKHLEIMVLPYRRNEILIWCNQGSYNVFIDNSYLQNEGAPVSTDPHPLVANGGSYSLPGRFVITQAGFATMKFPSVKGNFQLTPLTYWCMLSGGSLAYNVLPGIQLPYKPNSANWDPGDAITHTLDYDSWRSEDDGATATLTDGIAVDGSSDRMRWTLLMIGDRPDIVNHPTQCLQTPFLYGFGVQVPPASGTGPDGTASIENYIRALTRRYSEDSSSCDIEFKDPRTISEAYMTALNRYCRIYQLDGASNENELFLGQVTEPEYDEWPTSPDGIDHTPVKLTINDPWYRFDRMQLKNIRALDGMTLTAAVNHILDRVGWPASRRDIDTTTVTIPASPKNEEKLVLSDQVSSAGDLLRWVRDEFSTCSEPPYHWVMDFAPGIVASAQTILFRFKNPELFADVTSPASVRQLYSTKASAVAAGKTADDWVRKYRRKVREPEANYIIVAGESPDHEPIIVEDYDWASLNPDQGERALTGLGTTAGSTTLTGSGFTVNDVGSGVTVTDAGAGGGTLTTRIVEVTDATHAKMADAATGTTAGKSGNLYRPENWLGEIREYFYYNPAINTHADARRIAKALKRRLSRPRFLAEWEAEHSYDDRLYDRHKMIHDRNRRYSVIEIEVTHVLESASKTIRNARYRGESRDQV